MKKSMILDCTLRDGGYINEWNFGKKTIKSILNKLSTSNIDIIECGFLSDVLFDENKSLFNDLDILAEYIKPKNNDVMYVGMIALGEKEISNDKIKPYDGKSIDGIRITFHQHEIDKAFILANQLMEKGYKVFMQPVGTTSYTDEEIISLVKRINELKPFAFYLVDTLGSLYKNQLLRLFYLVDHNLDNSISIGFHSHNNLQLSFSNAQELIEINSKRNIIIDSSVFGMGRGAGNLCTELLAQYVNENMEERYNVVPILEIVDEHLNSIFAKFPWGYSVPYYLAAVNNCHPNYATHLLNKQTLTVKMISRLLKMIPNKNTTLYNKKLIEDIYIEYQKHNVEDKEQLIKINDIVKEKEIIVIAPGRSIEKKKEDINKFIEDKKPVVISVNFIPPNIKPDIIFISNLKRFNSLSDCLDRIDDKQIVVATSNITTENTSNLLVVNYSNLLNEEEIISDNAGLMLFNMLNMLQIREINLAGFDGFTNNILDNYYDDDMINGSQRDYLVEKSKAITAKVKELERKIDFNFITESVYK